MELTHRTTGLLYPIGSFVNRKLLVDIACSFVKALDATASLDFIGQLVLGLEIFASLPQFFVLSR